MECSSYEDVFEEIASRFYSDEPLVKALGVGGDGFRLRHGGMPLSLHPPPHLLLGQALLAAGGAENAFAHHPVPAAATNGCGGSGGDWVESLETLSWSDSRVARYNPASKTFRCEDCGAVGFLSRIAEHWLGAHANLKVFRCPRCPYSSAWARCVRMHLTRHHGEQQSDAALWRGSAALEEVTRLLHNLKARAESQAGATSQPTGQGSGSGSESTSDRRYACPQCPYATDRRDLYTRHENIHKEDKPFHCYACYKMFSRADHVKKHFLRMHKDRPYDIGLIRRHARPTGTPQPPYYDQPPPPPTSSRDSGLDCSRRSTSKKRRLPRLFACTYCPWRGVDNWCLKRHLNTHIKPFLCVLCDYRAARAERLSTHVLKIHNRRICSKCSYLAEDQAQLMRHLQDVHVGQPEEERSAVCNELTPQFRSSPEIRHLEERPPLTPAAQEPMVAAASEPDPEESSLLTEFRCRECGCEFADAASLQTHSLILHRCERVKPNLPYCCSVCSFSCAAQAAMMEHMRVHTGEVLQCRAEDCTFRTPFDSVLRDHVRFAHDDDCISRCPHCGAAVSSRPGLARHAPAHHLQPCMLCLAVVRKHFPDAAGSETDAGAHDQPLGADLHVVAQVKRPRRQSKPRKLVQTDDEAGPTTNTTSSSANANPKNQSPYVPCHRCRHCRRRPVYNLKKNWVIHLLWHHGRKRFSCEHCQAMYSHQYQVLLHSSRQHVGRNRPL